MNLTNLDRMYRLSLLEGQARAFLMDGTQLVERARQLHGLSRTATAALGRTLMATSILGAMLKGQDESVTCTIKGGGPIGTVLAVGKSDASVKGTVDHPEIELPRAGKKLPVGAAVGREGKLTVVKDMGLREPYVGQVNLVSGEIGEDFAMYFTASEQVPSLVSLGVLVSDRVEAAAALVVQMMPGAGEAAIQSVECSAPMFANISSTLREFGFEGAYAQLLSHLQPEILETISPRYRCDCSRERIERVLVTLGEEELRDMIREQHGAQVDCHFCDRRYRFSEADLEELLKFASGGRR